MLILPIKKKWLDMILNGEKREEYREVKEYWTVRIIHWLGFQGGETETVLELLKSSGTIKAKPVILQNGYGGKAAGRGYVQDFRWSRKGRMGS